jgi:23S rRNA U2552 (ribose-2'-O)-methylase RlmE/FtsJ
MATIRTQLLQLDDEFGFLSDASTTRVVDLCACPGA